MEFLIVWHGRKADPERAAFSDGAVDGQPTVKRLDKAARDREAETITVSQRPGFAVELGEIVEDLVDSFIGNPDARVFHLDYGFFVVGKCPDHDGTVGRREPDRVVEQSVEDLP